MVFSKYKVGWILGIERKGTIVKPTELYTPSQVGELALKEVESCLAESGDGIRFGFPNVDRVLKPLRPGNLAIIQAYTSNFKTGLAMNWARRIAKNLTETQNLDRNVVFVSWEDTVEEIGVYDLAYATKIDATEIQEGKLDDKSMERLKVAAFKRGAIPLWVIGNSLANRHAQCRLTMTQVEDTLGWLEQSMQMKPVAIFLDYLNKIQPEKNSRTFGDNRRTDIMELAYRASEMTFSRGCPVIAGAQSNRVSNDRQWKLPQKWDAMESSALEQYCQVMLSLWMPGLTEIAGEYLKGPDGKKTEWIVNENLLIMGINKQKRGPAGHWFPLYVNPAMNEVGPMTKDVPF